MEPKTTTIGQFLQHVLAEKTLKPRLGSTGDATNGGSQFGMHFVVITAFSILLINAVLAWVLYSKCKGLKH